jgi:energy-coupling factor transporter ATP-binding protein EcfA2
LRKGRTFGLYGDTGSGKTTQAGELAKLVFKQTGMKSILHTSDRGGFGSIEHLEEAGILEVDEMGPADDPWIWTNAAVSSKRDDVGVHIYDSGTSIGEALLSAAAHSQDQIGQQKTQRFTVTRGDQSLKVSLNNEAHYGLVQGFMLDAIWKSTYLTKQGADVLWTFAVHRGEEQDRTPILGPKLVGKALTPAIPKWFQYTWRLVSVPQDGAAPIHRLYLTEHSELAGLGHSFGNARVPLGTTIEIPPYIEPASIPEALGLIEAARKEAVDKLRKEMGQ